jgi:hypothetical protein
VALQVAEKPRIASEVRKKHVAGAEARADFGALAARLKSCPVTELRRISGGLSFSAACLATGFSFMLHEVRLAPQETRTYFVTAAAAQRRSIFQVTATAELLQQTIFDYRSQGEVSPARVRHHA